MKSVAFFATVMSLLCAATPMHAQTDYSAVVTRLESAIEAERRDWGIGGIAVALTDGTRVVHAGGYGEAEFDSVFRAGSISKVFNAVGVMQLVEAGRLALDEPLAQHPGLILPENPFPQAPPVTLRQLLCHRSGLQRESPVGGYFDPGEPSLATTCASLAGGALATAPASQMRYSNIAPSVAGHLVALVSQQPFETYQRENVLRPLGMTHSFWRRADIPPGRLIISRMRVADGRGGFAHDESPVFDLGTIPAGNLFTTAPDLARFLIELSRAMRGESTVLKPSTVADMWKPQIEESGAFGIGFSLGKFRGHRTVGHNGAVYGHSTAMVFLPETQLGVVMLANEDIVNARVGRLTDLALSLLLEAKTGEKPLPPATPEPVPELDQFAGQFESQSYWAEFSVDGDRLDGNFASQPCTLTPAGGLRFLLNSRIHADTPAVFQRDTLGHVTGFSVGPQAFSRITTSPRALPASWNRFLGSYGPSFIPLVVHEKFGHLYATTENMVDYRLTPVNRHVFALPPGMYTSEFAVFLGPDDGPASSIDFASMTLPRR